jgi:predicted nuclease with RNAse H fold
MITAGVDLATKPKLTACCVIDWSGSRRVLRLETGLDQEAVVRVVCAADRTAIDAPFGWPRPFVEFVQAHQAGKPLPVGELQLRSTDLFVKQVTGIRPLAVPASLIGATAMTCAQILGKIETERDCKVDRAGGGFVLEAYPAAALKLWGYPHSKYKGSRWRSTLRALSHAVVSHSGLQLSQKQRELLETNDDAFDALVCALVARTASLGRTRLPIDSAAAAVEGWIHLPLADQPLSNSITENQGRR